MPAKPYGSNGRLAGLIAALGLLGTAAPAMAQTVQSISPSTPDLGNVVSAPSGDTVFRVSASTGAVTRVSGTGARLATGTTRALVTIACADPQCPQKDINVRVGSFGSATGRAGQLSNFTVAPSSATFKVQPTGTNPVSFTLAPINTGGTATFWVGADMPIRGNESAAATGNATSGFYVYVSFSSAPTTGSTSGLAVARVFRPINIAASSNLAFGGIVRPASGTGTVAINASTGARTVSGTGIVGLSSPAPTRALYTVSGEGGQAFSLSFPASFQMTGPGTPLTVTLTSTASGTQSLSSAIGSAGTFALGIGGSFPISSTTATGLYQGTYRVTVQYN